MSTASDKVIIFDTTLRDGEQSPGATMTAEEKLDVAQQLARLKVDVIEAGFPASSPGDLEGVRRVALEVEGPIVCGLARTLKNDIDRAWEAVQGAARPRIHTFIGCSDIHLQHKLRMTREQGLNTAHEMVAYARSKCEDVEFSPEDAGRADPEFVYQVLEAVIAEGATTLNIPDTTGYCVPEEFAALIAGIRKNVRGIDRCVISVHCHNDLGMATANSLQAVLAGARQVECTINGLGERAGNAALEEVVMAIRTRPQYFGCHTDVVTEQIHITSQMVSQYTGFRIQPNKAVVGANAFAHESGIHQAGQLRNRMSYEIMTPESVGLSQSTLVLGKHSGRNAFKSHLQEMGYALEDQAIDQVFARFKELSDKKKLVGDADIEALLEDELYQPEEIYRLEQVQITCGDHSIPTATVRLTGPNGTAQDADLGTGPVDAVYRAIN
ncbi:MAG: 2-isopropylmalate synthase, partial [Anaerolineae bacterium]